MARGRLHDVIRNIKRRSWRGWLAVLGAGVFATMLAAWQPWYAPSALAYELEPYELWIVQDDGGDYAIRVARNPGARVTCAVIRIPGSEEIPDHVEFTRRERPYWFPESALLDVERHPPPLMTLVRAQGWPFKAFYGVQSFPYPSKPRGGAKVNRRVYELSITSPITYNLVVPYGVLLRGLLVNTAIFAIALLLVWETLGVVRRERRRRQSRCGWCGYDLIDAPDGLCPECGAAWRLPVDTQDQP